MKAIPVPLALLVVVAATVACATPGRLLGMTAPEPTVTKQPMEAPEPEESEPPTQTPEGLPSGPVLPLLPTRGETSSKTSLQAEVVDINWYPDSIGNLYFVGIIKNTGTADIGLPKITVTLRDSAGAMVGSTSGFSCLDIVPVGEISPFRVIFPDAPKAWATHEVVVQADEATYYTSIREFEVVSSQGKEDPYGIYTITGELRNTGASDAESVEVDVVAYNASGQILGVEVGFAELDVVPAGGTSPFEVMLFSHVEGEIDHYDLYVEGLPPM